MVSLSKLSLLTSISVALFVSMPGIAQRLSGAVGMVNAGFTSTHLAPTSDGEIADSIRFGNSYKTFGAEGYYRNGKAIIFLSGNLGFQAPIFRRDNLLEPFLWRAHAGFGWLLSDKSKFSIYPAVGLGVSGLSITDHTQQTDTHIEIAKTRTLSADLSLHCDYLILDPGSNDAVVNGIALGAKIGYNFGVVSPRQLQGWYLTVSVGGLAFLRKNR